MLPPSFSNMPQAIHGTITMIGCKSVLSCVCCHFVVIMFCFLNCTRKYGVTWLAMAQGLCCWPCTPAIPLPQPGTNIVFNSPRTCMSEGHKHTLLQQQQPTSDSATGLTGQKKTCHHKQPMSRHVWCARIDHWAGNLPGWLPLAESHLQATHRLWTLSPGCNCYCSLPHHTPHVYNTEQKPDQWTFSLLWDPNTHCAVELQANSTCTCTEANQWLNDWFPVCQSLFCCYISRQPPPSIVCETHSALWLENFANSSAATVLRTQSTCMHFHNVPTLMPSDIKRPPSLPLYSIKDHLHYLCMMTGHQTPGPAQSGHVHYPSLRHEGISR